MFYWIKNIPVSYDQQKQTEQPFFKSNEVQLQTKMQKWMNCKSEWTATMNVLQKWNAIHANANESSKQQLLHWSAICAHIASKQIHFLFSPPFTLVGSKPITWCSSNWILPFSHKHFTLWNTVWTRLQNCT